MRGEEENQKTHLEAVVYSPPMHEMHTSYTREVAPDADVSHAFLLSRTPVTVMLTASALELPR